MWDGARGHSSGLAEVVGLPTVVQSAYSPELNPAERVFEEKVEPVNEYLRRLESDPVRMRSLAGWDWKDEAV